MIKVKRIYEKPSLDDGRRILVDRLWPRGISKEAAQLDAWLKDIAPSSELRSWYGHDPVKWQEFKIRYAAELADRRELVDYIRGAEKEGVVTLLYGSKEERFNNAVALREYIETGKQRR